MGKRWDYDVPSTEVWAECLRVLKPGGHLLAFAGTRTQHRMAVRIEDAGFEIRDMIAWIYGSGFPKSLDVSKAIDNASGVTREVVGPSSTVNQKTTPSTTAMAPRPMHAEYGDMVPITAPATPAAIQWQGWGTALKPALEPITVARKPLCGTVAANVLAWGTGAINVDGGRVPGEWSTWKKTDGSISEGGLMPFSDQAHSRNPESPLGRFPSNLIHDGSDEVVGLFPNADARNGGNTGTDSGGVYSGTWGTTETAQYRDSGSAARFFYCAKASKSDRDEGCGALPFRESPEMVDREEDSPGMQSPRAGAGRKNGARNFHPTVKPTDLMRYLCRLVTQPGGTVLDPFMGSGSTGKAAMAEGFRFVGIERDPEYFNIAKARVASGIPRQMGLF
jgi:site-specific DNA-methyltransferase (adenine-specific)